MRNPIETMVVLALGATAVAGCTIAPQYREPETEVPAHFATQHEALAAFPTETSAWWTAFEDPVLTGLVEEASAANRDVRAAVARVTAARERSAQAALGRRPTGGAGAARTTGESSDFEQFSAVDSYRTGFDASWELDLFGRIGSTMRAADARAGTAEATLEDLQLTVTAEVARTYFELRGAESRTRLFEQYVADQETVVELTQARVDAGAASSEDLARSRAQLAADRARLLAERNRAARLEHALAVLVGRTPGEWRAPGAPSLAALEVRPIAVGDPAAMMRRRPDVRAAERRLAEANAEVGAATAALFPQVRISGFLGYVVGSASDIGASGSGSWLATPAISWPLFDLGRIRAGIRAREAEVDSALALYEQTVLRALADAEDAFTGYATAQRRLAVLRDQAGEARTAAELAGARYEEGESDYLGALDAARTARAAEATLLDGLVDQRLATIAVHKALGTAPRR